MTYHLKQLTARRWAGSWNPGVSINALFVYAVIIVALFLMAFIWLINYAVIAPLRAGILNGMTQYDVANTSYQSFEYADTFMFNFWGSFLVIAVFILLCWVYIYSQHKGEMLQ